MLVNSTAQALGEPYFWLSPGAREIMPDIEFRAHVEPPRYDSHYGQIVCEGYRRGFRDATAAPDTYRYETGVPTKEALVEVVATQRKRAVAALSERSSNAEVDVTVKIGAGFEADVTEREVLGETTLEDFNDDTSPFQWATSRPEYEQYIRCLRTQPGKRALEVRVSVDGEDKRVFVGARPTGGLVATGETGWLTDLDEDLQECRLVAALGEYRARYEVETARVVALTATPLASCQPFQRRSVMWASPSHSPVN